MDEQTLDMYTREIEEDLKAHRAIIQAFKDLFFAAQLDESGALYCVNANRFHEILDNVELLRE